MGRRNNGRLCSFKWNQTSSSAVHIYFLLQPCLLNLAVCFRSRASVLFCPLSTSISETSPHFQAPPVTASSSGPEASLGGRKITPVAASSGGQRRSSAVRRSFCCQSTARLRQFSRLVRLLTGIKASDVPVVVGPRRRGIHPEILTSLQLICSNVCTEWTNYNPLRNGGGGATAGVLVAHRPVWSGPSLYFLVLHVQCLKGFIVNEMYGFMSQSTALWLQMTHFLALTFFYSH